MMNLLYKSKRIGKNGKVFEMYKFRTLKNDADKTSKFVQEEQYTKFGRFLRKTKLDELPQLWNIIKGDLRFFGYRAEEERSFSVLPKEMQELLAREKPGLIDLSSLHFFDEENLMKFGDSHKTYWEAVRPMKFVLQMFYMQNRCFLLNFAIIWIFIKKFVYSFFKK